MTTPEQARETQRRRFQFLERCYDKSEASLHEILKTHEIGKELNLGDDETQRIVRYLGATDLLKVHDQGGFIAQMTTRGIDEVERALTNPDQPTQNFPPFNLIMVGQMTDSQIQQASPAAAQVIVHEDRYQELEEALKALKESIDQLSLTQQDVSDLRTDIQTIEAQMSKSAPNRTIITECVLSMVRILEQIAGTVVGGLVLAQFNALLGGD